MATGDPPSYLDLVGPGSVSPPCDVAFEQAPVLRLTHPTFKYDEHLYIEEARSYIASTYGQHYAGKNGVQALDLIFSAGHGEGFCVGDALKYLSRYGRKDGHNRKDLLKALHYIVLAMYLLDNEREKPKEK